MPKPTDHAFSPAELALQAVQAYHRAASLTGSLYQLRDCVSLPADVRPRYLAEIVLRSLAESRVAIALSGDTTSDPYAVAAAVFREILVTWGATVANDVQNRVTALLSGDMPTAANGGKS